MRHFHLEKLPLNSVTQNHFIYFGKMKIILAALLSIITSLAAAQKIEKYFDYEWHECDVSLARFYTIIVNTDSGWHRRNYFVGTKEIQLDCVYKDSLCNIPNGKFYSFFANKMLESTGFYVDGKKQGLWLGYASNKMITDSTTYRDNKPIRNSFKWYANGYLSDSSVWNEDESGLQATWFDNGNVSSTGRYTAGRKANGTWQFFHKNGKPASLEIYTNGVLISKQYFDETGNNIFDTSVEDRPAEFPGGKKGWDKFMQKHLYIPGNLEFTNNEIATVVVTFIVDEDGNIQNVETIIPFYPDLDEIVENTVKKFPKWLPAISHNRCIQSTMQTAITFELKQRRYIESYH